MWYLLFIIGLAASAAADLDPKERRLKYLATNQELHLEKLEKELHELEEEFGELSDDVDDETVKHLKARIRNLEDDRCTKHQASCGGDVPECVSKLLFCDGTKDCKNGNDEDEERCSEAPAHVGSSFTGIATWTNCEEIRPHNAVVTITASERKSFFSAVSFVRAILSFEVEEYHHTVRTYSLRGFYNFGQRRLLLGPERGAKPIYGVRCDFNLDDDDNADCTIVIPSSHEVCAHFQATRY